jgi:hypothetical protein
VIEPNGALHDRPAPVRSRRRKSAKWKSGLMLTGLGAVVLGAGYFAGVNAPAVANADSTRTVASAGINRFGGNDDGLLSPQSPNSDNSQGFLFNGDGNQGLQGDDGSFLFDGGNGSDSNGQFNQQAPTQQFGRQSRQFGFSQQQPNFGGPVTRSRGS